MTTLSNASMQVQSGRRFPQVQVSQCLVLIAVLIWPSVIEARRLESLWSANSWLQVQVGNWILAHGALPHTGIFSRCSDLPWADPNWGVQIGLGFLYRIVRMRALPVSVMVLRALFATATFILAGGRRANVWLAIVVTVLAQVGLVGSLFTPNILCSAILFVLELDVLARSREPGREKVLYWMPLLIAVWVNLDWRFLIGVAAFCLFCAVRAIEPYLEQRKWGLVLPDRPLMTRSFLGLIACATGIASLVSPNFYHSYVTAWQNIFGASLLENSISMKSLTFREPQHYLLLLLAMGTFFLIGKQRARDLFQVLLLAGAVCLGFALGTETWIVAVASVAVAGEFLAWRRSNKADPQRISGATFGVGIAISAVIIIIVAATVIPSNREVLLGRMATHLPVRASDFIRDQHLPGPIYNEIGWGGFLAWYLPDHPVAIDERYELYGETKTADYHKVTQWMVAPSSDSDFASANTVILSAENGLIRGVEIFPNPEEMFRTTFPGFRQVYKDELAVVLTKQP